MLTWVFYSMLTAGMDKVDAIFFIGPQGSGKGTQARVLAERLDFFYWEMGGIIREVAEEDTKLGRKTKELHDKGVLFDDSFLLGIVTHRLSVIPKERSVIFDGIPRRATQARFLLDLLRDKGKEYFYTIFLDVPKEDSLHRLLQRAETEHRADDTQEKIQFRLDQYYENTLPVLDILRQETKFITVDGRSQINEVTIAINKALGLE